MKRLSLLTLIFAVLSLVFFILLVFLRIDFPLYPLMSYQDAIDLLTPLVLIPIYWLLFQSLASERPRLSGEIIFIILAGLWVMGHGMHLAANSIDNLIDALAKDQIINLKPTDVYTLTYFYDEHLSHVIRDIGIVSLAALLIYREWRHPVGAQTVWWQAILGAILYGFTYFSTFLEGQTVALGLPFAFLVVAFGFLTGIRHLGKRPVLAFFFAACLLAFLLFAGWGLYWGGFPQFSDVGLI